MDIREKRKLQRLVREGTWDVDEFEKMESYFKSNPTKYKPYLNSLIRYVDFNVDGYHANFWFTINEVLPYTGGKSFLQALSSDLIPKGVNKEDIMANMEEFFHPYCDREDNWDRSILGMEGPLKEGLCSNDEIYRGESERFLEEIINLLQHLIKKDRSPDTDTSSEEEEREVFIKQILKLLYIIDSSIRNIDPIFTYKRSLNRIKVNNYRLPKKYKKFSY